MVQYHIPSFLPGGCHLKGMEGARYRPVLCSFETISKLASISGDGDVGTSAQTQPASICHPTTGYVRAIPLNGNELTSR